MKTVALLSSAERDKTFSISNSKYNNELAAAYNNRRSGMEAMRSNIWKSARL
jgi:hypothetical protein